MITVGVSRLLTAKGITVPEILSRRRDGWEQQGHIVVLIAQDDTGSVMQAVALPLRDCAG